MNMNMNMNNMFGGCQFPFEHEGEKYTISIDVNKIFQGMLLTFFRKGLKVESLQVPSGVKDKLHLSSVSNNGKYVFYVSIPNNNVHLANDFQRWISRFIYYNYNDEEFAQLKTAGLMAVEVRAKKRDEDWTEEMGENACKVYSSIWNLGSKYTNKDLYGVIAQFEKYSEKIKNLDKLEGEEYEENFEQVEKELEEMINGMKQKNPELLKDLFDIMGMGDIDLDSL